MRGMKMSEEDEKQFQFWYKHWAKKTGINPDPDDPKHYYDLSLIHISEPTRPY